MIGLALALMELSVTYPWSLVVGLWVEGEPRPILSAWSILGLVTGALLLGGWLERRDWPARIVGAIGVGAGLALVTAAAWLEHGPPTFGLTPTTLALLLGVHLWRRGLIHGQGAAGRDEVARLLGAGTIALAICLVLAAADGGRSLAVLQDGASAHVVGFFGIGLAGLAAARLREVRRKSAGGLGGEGSRDWLGLVAATVLGLLVAAVVVGQVVSLDLAASVLRPIIWAISFVLLVVFAVVGLPLMLALEVLFNWLRPMIRAPISFDLRSGFGLDQLPERSLSQPPPEWLYIIAQWLAIGLVVAAAILLIARAMLRRSAASEDDEVHEERDSVWSWALLLHAARDWLARLRGRLGRRRIAAAVESGTRGDQEAPAITSLRQLYRDVLGLAARKGAARPAQATPYEQLPRLQAALGHEDALEAVTHAYVRVRYGEHPPAAAELDALRGWWERVRVEP